MTAEGKDASSAAHTLTVSSNTAEQKVLFVWILTKWPACETFCKPTAYASYKEAVARVDQHLKARFKGEEWRLKCEQPKRLEERAVAIIPTVALYPYIEDIELYGGRCLAATSAHDDFKYPTHRSETLFSSIEFIMGNDFDTIACVPGKEIVLIVNLDVYDRGDTPETESETIVMQWNLVASVLFQH